MRKSALGLILIAALGVIPSPALDLCTPSQAVKTALDALPTQSPSDKDWGFRQKRRAALEDLLNRFPGDLFVAKAYVDSMYRGSDKEQLIAEYKRGHEQNPDDPQLAYLYGLALIGRQSRDAIKLFDSALTKAPEFAWPQLALAQIYALPVFLNKDDRDKHVKDFLAACPDSLDGYEQLASLDDKAVLAANAARLRAMLATRTDPDSIDAYTTLWSIEFKAHAVSEYDGLRQVVAGDLKRLRVLNREDKRQWWETLEQGYKLANDQKQSDWALEERQRRVPQPWELRSMTKWRKDHPNPQKEDAADKKHAFNTELLKQTELWLKERPAMMAALNSRLNAMEHLDNIPDAAIEAVASEYLKAATSNAGPEGPGSSVYFTIARVLSKKHLQPDRVLELARKGLAQAQVESSVPPYDLYATKEDLQETNFYWAVPVVRGVGFEAGADIDLKQTAEVRMALLRMEDQLQTLKKLAGDKAELKKEHTLSMVVWWGLMARHAELDNRNQDAMAFYEMRMRCSRASKPKRSPRLASRMNWPRMPASSGSGWEAPMTAGRFGTAAPPMYCRAWPRSLGKMPINRWLRSS